MMKYAGESNLKRVSVECGGKSPLIVMADALDLDAAATEAAWGVFYNQGQVCNASTRLLVEASIKDAFVAKVAEVAKTIKVSHPLDPNSTIGAVVDETQFKSVCGFIEKGKSEGANVVLGGGTLDTEKGGFYLEPTIFSDVVNDMTIAQKEIFGPVLSVISFETEEEAIEIANDTIYGLGAGVFTKDINRAMRMSRALNAGCVWVNTYDAGDMSATFGGYKQSGFGRDKSLHALDKYSEIKNTWIATP
jgi:acyl-CoA reductase-like NAD-dependent aldehyde dehydrogenase